MYDIYRFFSFLLKQTDIYRCFSSYDKVKNGLQHLNFSCALALKLKEE